MGIFSFLNEVKQEAKQIKWSDSKSTYMGLVLVMGTIVISSIIFFLIDSVSRYVINYIINIW